MEESKRIRKNEINKAYYKRNRAKILEKSKEASKDRYKNKKEHVDAITRKWKTNNMEKFMYSSAKNRCRKSGMDFSIDISDVVIPDVCPYLGIKLTKEYGKGRLDSNVSLDRIDNSKGYVKGNIHVISSKANLMKSNASIEELIEFAKNVIKIHG